MPTSSPIGCVETSCLSRRQQTKYPGRRCCCKPAVRQKAKGDESYTTLRITEIVNQLRAAGHAIADRDLARVSPLMHSHVIPNGTYRFSDEEEPGHVYAAAS